MVQVFFSSLPIWREHDGQQEKWNYFLFLWCNIVMKFAMPDRCVPFWLWQHIDSDANGVSLPILSYHILCVVVVVVLFISFFCFIVTIFFLFFCYCREKRPHLFHSVYNEQQKNQFRYIIKCLMCRYTNRSTICDMICPYVNTMSTAVVSSKEWNKKHNNINENIGLDLHAILVWLVL